MDFSFLYNRLQTLWKIHEKARKNKSFNIWDNRYDFTRRTAAVLLVNIQIKSCIITIDAISYRIQVFYKQPARGHKAGWCVDTGKLKA